jgi:pyruvate formate lyase activating enzyme
MVDAFMVVGGLQKFSLSDFPGMISAIVFTQGCGFRCPYCHNPELVDPPRFSPAFPQMELGRFLRSRREVLRGVVVTGGEPTFHSDLPELLAELKDMGFSVKLDTNGTNPLMLQHVIAERLVDFIAMDIKAPLDVYAETVCAAVKTHDILQSIELILRSGLSHEFRTTWAPWLLTKRDIAAIAGLVRGCERYVVGVCQTAEILDPDLVRRPLRDSSSLEDVVRFVSAAGLPIAIR